MFLGALSIPSFALFLVTCGVLPRRAQVALSAVMHKLKRTHSRKPSDRKFNYHKIDKHLILGRQPRNEQDIDNLIEEENVRVFVTLNEEWELFVPSEIVISKLIAKAGEEKYDVRFRFTTPDYQAPSLDELIRTSKFIQGHIEANRTVYVHCNAGKGRSSVVVAAYLMFTNEQWTSAAEVVRHLRNLRKQVSFALLDWPLRAQARAVASFYEWVKANKKIGDRSLP